MNIKRMVESKKAQIQREINHLKNKLDQATWDLANGRIVNTLGIIQNTNLDRLCGELGAVIDIQREMELEEGEVTNE